MAYLVFSVISGISCLILACVPGYGSKGRLGCAALGVFFIGYAVWVSRQTAGVYYFSVWIFVIPFITLGGFLWKLRNLGRRRTPPFDPAAVAQIVRQRAYGVPSVPSVDAGSAPSPLTDAPPPGAG